MKLVKIEWWDAHSKDEWHDSPVKYEPLIVVSYGLISEEYLESLNKKVVLSEGIVLIPNSCDREQQFGDVHIPRGCIKSILELDESSEQDGEKDDQ